ncbi:MAG: 5'-nucleotidase C-terminal domain-containing protein [Cyclonatronaceae bacterium]
MMITSPAFPAVKRFSKTFLSAFLLSGLLFSGGCGSFSGSTSEKDFAHQRSDFSSEYTEMDAAITEDAEVEAFLSEYAEALNREMNRRISISTAVIERGQPESPLGNLTADITRERASRALGREVDIALLNRGGLRTPIPEGDVTVGMMYELMPFENYITLLKFSGEQIRDIANELAVEGGEPVSGLRMRIDGDRATDILVGGDPVRAGQTYWLATNNWMADGGGPIPTLWEPLERRDTTTLLRDAFIESLNTRQEISPETDGRIRE